MKFTVAILALLACGCKGPLPDPPIAVTYTKHVHGTKHVYFPTFEDTKP